MKQRMCSSNVTIEKSLKFIL